MADLPAGSGKSRLPKRNAEAGRVGSIPFLCIAIAITAVDAFLARKNPSRRIPSQPDCDLRRPIRI